MAECMDVIYQRRSIRKFNVVTNPVVKKKLISVALNQQFLVPAPVVIVFCANTPRSSRVYSGRGEPYSMQDTTASIMTLMLGRSFQ